MDDLAGSEHFSTLIGEPGQRDARLPCIREDSFVNVDRSFAEGGGIPFRPGVVQAPIRTLCWRLGSLGSLVATFPANYLDIFE